MAWGSLIVGTEVATWLRSLNEGDFGQARHYIDLLTEQGVHLGEPISRHLRGKLRELRFRVAGRHCRITYFIAPHRRIVLLTVFAKSRPRERLEVERAWRAMNRFLTDHSAPEEEA